MRKYIVLLIIVLFAAATHAQSYKVIVNSANAATQLTKAEASNYLLKKTHKMGGQCRSSSG